MQHLHHTHLISSLLTSKGDVELIDTGGRNGNFIIAVHGVVRGVLREGGISVSCVGRDEAAERARGESWWIWGLEEDHLDEEAIDESLECRRWRRGEGRRGRVLFLDGLGASVS